MEPDWFALSIKQPWAALLVAGIKTIEVRTWPTTRRGPVLIHASKTPDPRPEAWAHVPPELEPMTKLVGGILGRGELADCITYPDRDAFAADAERHRNPADWFVESGLYGFAFRDLRPVPFVARPGQTFFFRVRGYKV